jgi:two-component system chemotaxis response regulator CheB
MMSSTIRVLVVDDSAFMRRAISRMLTSDKAIEVVGIGRNGREAVELVAKLRPDVVTLDIEMPEMDGLTALQKIMAATPTHVVMLSSLTTAGSHAALRALSLGAADVLAKDSSQMSLAITNIQDELVGKVRALGANHKWRSCTTPRVIAPIAQVPVFKTGQFDVICIGSSTGGPPVLEKILAAMPASLTTPIVVAQHMPAVFTASMAQRLSEICQLRVRHVESGMPLERRTIYISPGGKHTHFHRKNLISTELVVKDDPVTAPYRPSVDVLFATAAAAFRGRVLGVVLTGMGNDGLAGGRELHKLGSTILAQSEETCVVYGMPKAVTENALITASLTPDQIAKAMTQLADRAAA